QGASFWIGKQFGQRRWRYDGARVAKQILKFGGLIIFDTLQEVDHNAGIGRDQSSFFPRNSSQLSSNCTLPFSAKRRCDARLWARSRIASRTVSATPAPSALAASSDRPSTSTVILRISFMGH